MKTPVTVLVPARNEEANILETIRSLRTQSEPPARIVVIANNCTDGTADVARGAGVEVVDLPACPGKKAGALNAVLEDLLDSCDHHILVMDADSVLDRTWIAVASAYLAAGYDACGGVFTGGEGGGLVGMFQRNEYARYQRDVRRRKGRTLVLTGTATLFRASALRDVVAARRDGRLPNQHPEAEGRAQVYDVHVLTEDNELTLAFLHLEKRIIAPADCHLVTEVMCTWKDLGKQRLRWKRGAIENLLQYGFTRVTLTYWGRQLLSAMGLIVTAIYLVTLVTAPFLGFHFHPWWICLSVVFSAEQVVTVRSRGWRQQVLASILVIEMAYDLYLQAIHAKALIVSTINTERKW